MSASLPPIPTLMPHEMAAKPLADINKMIASASDGEPVIYSEYFAKMFSHSAAAPTDTTDLRKAIYAELAAKESQMLAYSVRLKTYIASVQAAMAALVDNTIDTLHIHPHVDFSDSLGTRLRLQVNAQPKLEIDENLVPDEYMITKTTTVIDKERIRAELLAGEELHWAYMMRGVHLKGLK